MTQIKRAAVLMIEDDQGKILLSKKGPKSRYEPGFWELCGGALDSGEDFSDTAKREALEELGVEVEIVNTLSHDTYPDMGDGVVWEVRVFKAKTKNAPKIMEPDKCVELRWVSKEEISLMKGELSVHLKMDLEKLGWI
ncbi:NUDIX hydrolase [Patescibacteria group bacterium]